MSFSKGEIKIWQTEINLVLLIITEQILNVLKRSKIAFIRVKNILLLNYRGNEILSQTLAFVSCRVISV
jgi:hypothetical protein